jgi:hypothetical protein
MERGKQTLASSIVQYSRPLINIKLYVIYVIFMAVLSSIKRTKNGDVSFIT